MKAKSPKYHFEHHRREALLNKRRFGVLNAVLVSLLVIAGGWVYFAASHAVSYGFTMPIANITPGNNVNVNPGQTITLRAGYVNNSSTAEGGSLTVNGLIPPHTHLVSQGNGQDTSGNSNPYVTGYGVDTTTYPTEPRVYWNLSQIPASGAPYNAWEGFYYNVQVDGNAPVGYNIRAYAFLLQNNVNVKSSDSWTSNVVAAAPPPPPPATVSISASSTQVTQNGALTISWSSTNATACNASGTTWSGARGASGSEPRNSDTGTVRTLTYTMSCNNSTYGGNSASVNINVVATAPPPPPPVSPPTVSVSTSSATVYQYTGLNVSWASQNASSCNASGTTWSGAKTTTSNSEDRSSDTAIIRALSYILTCSNSGGNGSASAGTNVIKSAAPSVPAGLRVDSQTASSLRVTWQPSTAAQGSSINYYQVRNSGGTAIGTTVLTNFVANSGLAACRTYSFTVVAVNNQDTVSAPSASVSGSTTGCPPAISPTPTPAPVQNSSPPPKPGARPKVTGGTTANPTSAPMVVPDTVAPTVPKNLKGSVDSDGSTVHLTWDAATDDKAVASYQVERSTDQKTWDVLTTKATETKYTDTATTFSVHYFYRVKAIDGAGNTGPAVAADVTTKAFVANTNASQTTTISSPDGLVSVQLPNGAVDSQTACSIVTDSSNQDLLKNAKLLVAAGPYSLSCKQSDGTQVDHFNSVVTIQVSQKAKAFAKYASIKLYAFDNANNKWAALVIALNKKTHVLSATSSTPIQVVVLGVAKKGLPLNLFVVVIFVLGLIGAFFAWRVRQQQKVQYNEYIRHKYYDL